MLGLKAAARRKNRSQLSPKDIPGFSKWITSEVYIEDKIAESSLESLALNMMKNIEWINEAMNDINDTVVSEDDDHEEILNDIVLQTNDNSLLLLKSPKRIIDESSSPLKEVRKREIEVIKNTTTLVLDNAMVEEPRVVSNNVVDDSFELIKRDIRKSFASKQKAAEVPPSNIQISKMKTAEDEIKELSRLLDNVSDANSSDGDLTIEFDKLEKIELSQIKKKPAVITEYKSPIKFSEMPMIEPLTLGSSRKKSMKKSIAPKRKRSTATLSTTNTTTIPAKATTSSTTTTKTSRNTTATTIITPTPKKHTTVFTENASKDNLSLNKSFQLKPLPNDIFAAGNTSLDEPTIKLDRNFVKSMKHDVINDENSNSVTNTKRNSNSRSNINNSLISRLMQPTEASRRKSRISSPNKSAKVSLKSSPQRSHVQEIEKAIRKQPHSFVELKAPIETIKATTSPIKKQIPLSKRSLKSNINYDELYSSKDIENDIKPGLLYQDRIRNTTENSKIPIINVSDRKKLQNIRKSNPRLNQQISKEQSKVKTEPIGISEDWSSDKNILKQMELQKHINPFNIFGEIPVFDCESVFKRKYATEMKIEWAKQDVLSREEQEQYEKSMGYE